MVTRRREGTIRKFSPYAICLDKHATFHIEAGKIAAKINEKKFNDAEAMLNAGQPYTTASNSLNILKCWRRLKTDHLERLVPIEY